MQYGNDEKFKQISTENMEPTTRKHIENKSTLVDMCFQMGLIIEANERLSKRVCKPCGRKIRKAHECFTFIRSNLDSPTAHAQTFDTLVSNQRFKRQLPSTITPERIRSQTIKKTSTALQKARKALGYDEIEIENETPNNDAIMFALNIDELCNTEKKETQLKTIIVHPNGNIETRLNFEECTKKIILNLISMATSERWQTWSSNCQEFRISYGMFFGERLPVNLKSVVETVQNPC